MAAQDNCFPKALQSNPGIYIPVLFIKEEKLREIFKALDILTPYKIDIHPKTLSNGTSCTYAFIVPYAWHSNETAQKMRTRLLAQQEVKIVVDEHCYFICKPKHEEGIDYSPLPSAEPTYIDFNHIAPAPRNVKGVSRTSSPKTVNDDDFCPECEDGVLGNQLGHTCIQRIIAKDEEESWQEEV